MSAAVAADKDTTPPITTPSSAPSPSQSGTPDADKNQETPSAPDKHERKSVDSNSQPSENRSAAEQPKVEPPAKTPPEVTVPYTGSEPLADTQQTAGEPGSGSLKGYRYDAKRQIGNGWRQQGVLMMNDFTGNKKPDLIYAYPENGSVFLRLYPGYGKGRVSVGPVIGQGWQIFDYLLSGDVNRDGRSDIIARKKDGTLWLYLTNPRTNRFNSGFQIGNGWGIMRSLTFVPSSVSGRSAIIALDKAGVMHSYAFANIRGRFYSPVTFGGGWKVMNRVQTVGDMDGNGRSDLLVTSNQGFLYLYRASQNGRTFTSYRVGHGWNQVPAMMAIYDHLNGGGIMALDKAGKLYYYGLRNSLRKIVVARPASGIPSRYLQPTTRIRPVTSTVVPRAGWNGTKVKVVREAVGVGAPLNAGTTMDARAVNAVMRFQSRIGYRRTGVVDYNTWRRLTRRSWTMDQWQMQPQVGLGASKAQRVEALVNMGRRAIGTRYTWGGAGPNGDGYDCSGLALQAIYAAGFDPQPINVIAHAGPTYRTSKALYSYSRFQKVPFGSRKRGDLIFWQGRYGIYHVAIYLGGNQIIESMYGYAHQRGLYNWGNIAPYVVRPVAS